jgi:hypothetical protein
VTVTQDPVFKFRIENTGSANLTSVRLNDAQFGIGDLVPDGSLVPGQTITFNATLSFVAGLSNNSAQVRGTFVNPSFPTRSEQASASDVAWTFGKEDDGPLPNPELTVTTRALDIVADDYKVRGMQLCVPSSCLQAGA